MVVRCRGLIERAEMARLEAEFKQLNNKLLNEREDTARLKAMLDRVEHELQHHKKSNGEGA